ncbi:MAG: TonB-dependent receptor, partial [Gemmatimonadetes bacterium]|nr:TonB-dependent receptor [Gemmatimonadota bacterium]
MRSSNLFPAFPALAVLLLAAAYAGAAPLTMSGTVVDAETGEPLAGANLIAKNLAVITDEDGRFELPLAAGDSAAVSHVGYEPAVIRARPGAPGPLTVRLRPVVLQVAETVVTGGLTEQALGEVSSAVTVFDRGRIDAGGGHLQELIPAVPNLNWAGGTSRPRYFQIRGMGERSHYAGEGPPSFSVGFVMDDVDLSGLGMAGMLHDLDQAEVFKGPQSTIFGPNAMAGLINLKSADPTGSMSLGGTVSAGSDGLLRISPTLNVPAGEQLALRVGGSWGRSNGFRENRHLGVDDSNRRNETLARAKLRYGNGAGARLVATFFRADLDNGYDAWVPDNNEDLATYSDNPGVDSQTTHAASLRGSLPLAASGAELVSITSWGRTELEHSYDGDWGNDEFWKQEPYGFDPEEQGWSYDFFDRNLRDRTTFTQEVRLLKEDRGGSGDLVAGAYLKSLRENDDAGGWLFGGDATDLQSRFDIADLAFYGQYSRELSPRWRLTLNARLDRNATSYEGTTNSGAEQVEFEVTQWLPGGKLALTHALAPNRNLYAAVSRGFRAGGVNQHPRLAPASRPFDPEYVLNWELGYRASGTRATTALTFFHALRSDQQVELSSQQDP